MNNSPPVLSPVPLPSMASSDSSNQRASCLDHLTGLCTRAFTVPSLSTSEAPDPISRGLLGLWSAPVCPSPAELFHPQGSELTRKSAFAPPCSTFSSHRCLLLTPYSMEMLSSVLQVPSQKCERKWGLIINLTSAVTKSDLTG